MTTVADKSRAPPLRNDLVPRVILFRGATEACANSAQIRIVDFPRDHAETIEFTMLRHSRVHGDPG